MAKTSPEKIRSLWEVACEMHPEKSTEWLMSHVAALSKCDVGDVAAALQEATIKPAEG